MMPGEPFIVSGLGQKTKVKPQSHVLSGVSYQYAALFWSPSFRVRSA